MLTLRIAHKAGQVELALEGDGPRRIERRPFSFQLTAQEAENIRWYLEDYRVCAVDPKPIVRRIERRIEEVGRELFNLALGGGEVWEAARRRLSDTRIETETGVADALVPWELMRDPDADLPLALGVASLVRCYSRPALPPKPPASPTGKIRILLAICRLEDDGVPFRSVARHLIRGLSDAAREPFELEVLRPPSFEQFARRLRHAKAEGDPFHAVHFDGHGLSGEVHFENPDSPRKADPVKAAELGKLLHETGVPLLILNACRSGASEPREQPEQASDLHRQIREFGSFAHAIMDYGASGVVAWRYSVFVDTAAQYMADLYAALARGLPLGESATLARKQLSSGARPIADWTVPVVFEAAPVRLFPKAAETFEIKLEAPAASESGLPEAPDVGFIGRDETILRLDRAFDEQHVILLHAYAGSGKTSTAAEFARWYKQTGGLSGPVLFTSFGRHKPLPQVLDDLGRIFEGALARQAIQWLTLDDAQRRDVALQVLRQVQVLWIWDNVEPVAGFPTGTPSAWSAAEQKELFDFLCAARGTKAKFLLTSRRDERGWLHDLPARIELPPMPFDERVMMTEALAKKVGRRLEDVEDWRPLIRFTQGNPLTLTVVVGQVLSDGLKSREQVAAYVCRVQAGEPVFDDEASEGRTRSLGASLAYGFNQAFTEAERRQLALLHLFQGCAQVIALCMMGDPEGQYCLPEVNGLTRDAAIGLLDKAAEVGLLSAKGGGYYRIHPALPWFFRRLFDQYYAEAHLAAARAFVTAMAAMGTYYFRQYEDGNREVITAVAAEELNLLYARSLAQSNGWRDVVVKLMQGLYQLYWHTGRFAEWSHLVEEIVPDFVEPATEGPLPGREEDDDWTIVTGYRVRLAMWARRWDDAERLQNVDVGWSRQHAAAILAKAPAGWSPAEKNAIRGLAVSLHELSQIQREQGSAKCLDGFLEAISLSQKIGDAQSEAFCEFNLGRAYAELDTIRDLALAERCFKRSLGLRNNPMDIAICLVELGTVAYERFREARKARRTEERLGALSEAQGYYQRALDIFPANAPRGVAVARHQLGAVYTEAGQIEAALCHFREAVRYCGAVKDRFGAGNARLSAARALARTGRLVDARDWAQAALRDFEACGNAAGKVVDTLKLLEFIESCLRASSPPS